MSKTDLASNVNSTENEMFSVTIDNEQFEISEKILESGKRLSEILTTAIATVEFIEFKKDLDNKEFKKVYTSTVFNSINQLCNEDNIIHLKAGTKVLRARIVRDFNDIYHERNGIHFEKEVLRGYDWYNSKEPAIGIASEGRANCQYSSYFYCSNDAATAASEIKANIGDYISLAAFLVKRELKLIKLEQKDWFNGKTKEDCYQDNISNHFSRPVSDFSEYRFTQFISDELRKHGIDGLCYKSHFTNKTNYVIFNCSMETINFLNSKIIQLHSQQLNFIDFSSLKMLSTKPIPNLDMNSIKNERDHIYDVIQSAKIEKYTEKNFDDSEDI
ncbi:MAG: RES family NAD+ phosphorylase [Clostridia bacterium]|nr:RES family NAD+ phosphorylase [Clostridia bacterium]